MGAGAMPTMDTPPLTWLPFAKTVLKRAVPGHALLAFQCVYVHPANHHAQGTGAQKESTTLVAKLPIGRLVSATHVSVQKRFNRIGVILSLICEYWTTLRGRTRVGTGFRYIPIQYNTPQHTAGVKVSRFTPEISCYPLTFNL